MRLRFHPRPPAFLLLASFALWVLALAPGGSARASTRDVAADAPEGTATDELPSHLRLGRVAHDPDRGEGWSIAVRLPHAPDRVRLRSESLSLSLLPGPGGTTRVVLAPEVPGPASGLLVIDDGGVDVHVLVSGEVVHADRADWPAVATTHRDLRRTLDYELRLHGLPAARSLRLETGALVLDAPDDEGWQSLPRPGTLPASMRPARDTAVGERRGRLVLSDGTTELPLHSTMLEAITVTARAQLDESFRWSRILPLRERLANGEIRARVALRGRRAGARRLRTLALTGPRQEPSFSLRGGMELPSLEAGVRARMLRLRVPTSEPGVRVPRLLQLVGERALLIDPRLGLRKGRRVEGMRFLGAAAASPLAKNGALAVRRRLSTGETFLRHWWVENDGGETRLRSRRLEPPLDETWGAAPERIFDAVISVRDRGWPEQPLAERLVLLGRARTQPRLWGVRYDRASGRTLAGRRLWTGSRQIPAEGPAPRLRWLPSRVAGSGGLPIGVRVDLPSVRVTRLLRQQEFGARLSPVRDLPLLSPRATTTGVDLFPRLLIRMDRDPEQGVRLRRFAETENGLALRARRFLPGETPVRVRASARRRHAWALTESEGRRFLRFADVGLDPARNLPPHVDAGGDLRVRASSSEGALVDLRARVRDVDGDELALRWSAAGIRFDDPTAPGVRARFPVGTTRVRVRVRDGRPLGTAGKATVPYEDTDVVEVTVAASTPAPPASGLRTAIAGVFPNPANPRVTIAFSLHEGGPVRLEVMDLRGRHVRTLLDDRRTAGAWDVRWDGDDEDGRPVASGVYLVRLRGAGRTDTDRVVLVR